jgi:hypothetical protein
MSKKQVSELREQLAAINAQRRICNSAELVAQAEQLFEQIFKLEWAMLSKARKIKIIKNGNWLNEAELIAKLG